MRHQPSAQTVMEPDHVLGTGRTNGFATVSDGSPLRQPPAPMSSPLETSSIYLSPGDQFPSTLAELDLVELHVLHSRVARQLDTEYRTDPSGPHPVTLDRAQELMDELDTRQEFLAGPGTDRIPVAAASRVENTSPAEAARAPGRDTAGSRSRRRPATAPRRLDEHSDVLFPHRDRVVRGIDVRIEDLDRLWPEDRIEVWHDERLRCVGIVELAAPALGVLWIRDALDGCRRMLHLHDAVLRYHLPSEPRRPAS